MVVTVSNINIDFLVTVVTLVTKVTNFPMVTFTTMVTKVTSVRWLLYLHERSRSVTLFGHFLSCSTNCIR